MHSPMKNTRLLKHVPALAFTLTLLGSSVGVQAQVTGSDGWKTILSTRREVKEHPEQKANLEKGLLHVRAPNGILTPQKSADGAIRARLHFLPGMVNPQLRIRSSGSTETKNAKFYMVLIRATEQVSEVKRLEINLTAPGNAGKPLGSAPLAKPFKVGEHMDLEFSAKGNSLQVLVDGQLVFEVEDNFISEPGDWGIASGNAWFSNIQIRSGSGEAKATASTPPESRLAQLEEAYAAACQRDAITVYDQGVKELNEKYAAALERAMEASTKIGNLDDAVIYREEKERVLADTLAQADEKPLLKTLRETYWTSLEKLHSQREQKLLDLREKFVRQLDLYQAELTKAGDLDGALAARARKEQELGKKE